jgi:apolipoprotein D and lipocalin family protein
MRRIALLAGGLLIGIAAGKALARAGGDAKPLDTIAALDTQRYLGTWYEIARFPNAFQHQCAGDVSATYSLRDDGRIRVLNRCRRADGSEDSAEGVARQIGGPASPKLEVRFAPAILSLIPMVWGDYWVVDLDENYTLSAVSEPSRKYLWILSRTRQVDPAAYQALLARLAAQGLDVSKLERTSQGE